MEQLESKTDISIRSRFFHYIAHFFPSPKYNIHFGYRNFVSRKVIYRRRFFGKERERREERAREKKLQSSRHCLSLFLFFFVVGNINAGWLGPRDTDSMNNVRNVAPEIRTGAYELTIVI